MSLSGKQFQTLQDALLSAFQSRADLEQLTLFQLEENLNHIAGGDNLSSIVFNLIQWAEARGRTQELVEGALEQNPRNSALQAFAAAYLGAESLVSGSAAKQDSESATGSGDQISVGDIANSTGVAVGRGNQINITHHTYYNNPPTPQSHVGDSDADGSKTTDTAPEQ